MRWSEAVSVLRARAAYQNGTLDTASGKLPALTRQQAASLILGGVRVTTRANMSWPSWYDLALPTLGHYAESDKFQMMAPFQASKLDPATSESLWGAMNKLAGELDAHDVPFTPADFAPSSTRYDQLAKMAWGSLKMRRGDFDAPQTDANGIPLVPKPVRDVLKDPPKVPVPQPAPSKTSGLGLGLLILGGLWMLSDSKRRRR
jgi:MYXO-CTERM domain-containing protein